MLEKVADEVPPAPTVTVAIDSYELVTNFDFVMPEAIIPKIKTGRPQW